MVPGLVGVGRVRDARAPGFLRLTAQREAVLSDLGLRGENLRLEVA